MNRIRYAKIEDAEILSQMHLLSWKAAYKGIVPQEYLDRMTPEKRMAYFSKVLSEGNKNDAIIFENKTPVGLISIGNCRDEDKDSSYGELRGLYLLPEYWHKGIGTYAVNWAINELRNRSYSCITLWVLKDNMIARKFYEKMEFASDGTEKEIMIGKPLIECRYTRLIKP